MRSLRHPAALRAAVTLLLLSGCTGGDAPAGLDGAGATLSLPIAAAELPRGVDAPALPINRIRATARAVPEGAVLGTVVLDVNPTAASWQVEFDVDLGALPTVTARSRSPSRWAASWRVRPGRSRPRSSPPVRPRSSSGARSIPPPP
jgi:hypothetical protein